MRGISSSINPPAGGKVLRIELNSKANLKVLRL